VFSERLGIRPWEIGKLSVADFEALLDYIEDPGGD
jgi:hypothetical protein